MLKCLKYRVRSGRIEQWYRMVEKVEISQGSEQHGVDLALYPLGSGI